MKYLVVVRKTVAKDSRRTRECTVIVDIPHFDYLDLFNAAMAASHHPQTTWKSGIKLSRDSREL
jgi:hypothetical protein